MKKLSLLAFAAAFTLSSVYGSSANAISLYQSCNKMKPFAHRAMSGSKNIERGYEDTSRAIKDTMAKGFDVEIDVWRSSVDGTLAIMHDRDVTHTTHQVSGSPALPSNNITDLNFDQIRTLRTNDYNYWLPSLQGALSAAKSKSDTKRLRIEFKGNTSEWPNSAIDDFVSIANSKNMLNRVQIFSSNLGLLKRVEANHPQVATVWKYNKSAIFDPAVTLPQMQSAGINAMAIEDFKINNSDMQTVVDAGITLGARLANDKVRFRDYATKAGGGYFKSIQSNYAGTYRSWCNAKK